MERVTAQRLCASVALLLQLGSASNEAVAQTRSQAETLFQQGRIALNEGRAEEACDSFRRSHDLEPTVGALLNLGNCLELQGQYASAANSYAEARRLAASTGDMERVDVALTAEKRLDEMSPRLTITVPDRTPDTIVKVNGKTLPAQSVGMPMRLDPGTHRVSVAASGADGRDHSIVLAGATAGQPAKWAEVVLWASAQRAPGPMTEPSRLASGNRQFDSADSRENTQRAWDWVGGGMLTVGAASVLGATLYGLAAMTDARRADCDVNESCSPEGLSERGRAREQLAVSYAVGIAGGVIAIGGLTMILWSPSDDTPGSVGLTVSPTNVHVVGAF